MNSEEVFKKLKTVFGIYGYEGATLSIISEAVGLKRASLYHHFPNGKQEMAQFVLDEIGKWVDENIVQICFSGLPLKERIEIVVNKINEMYECGNASCLWRVFSLGVSLALFQVTIEKQVRHLLQGIAKLFEDAGENQETAQKSAINFLIEIQGRLVLVNALNDTSYFSNFLEDFKKQMMG